MDRWQGIQHVVVVGLGITGLSVVNYLRKYHPSVTVQVIDTREAPPGQEQLSSDVALHCVGDAGNPTSAGRWNSCCR